MIVVCMFQLENQYSLFDYSININDVIQLTIVSVTETNTIKKSMSKVSENLKDNESILSCSSDTSSKTEEVTNLSQ